VSFKEPENSHSTWMKNREDVTVRKLALHPDEKLGTVTTVGL
jgi:hypothetical protein